MNIVIKNLKKAFGDKAAIKQVLSQTSSDGAEQEHEQEHKNVKIAVDIDEYKIEDGQILGLVGNNGAGKSTLFRLILDLIKADTGNVRMQGTYNGYPVDIDVSKTEAWKDWTGAYVDDSFLIDYLTPDEYFQFIARICGMSNDKLKEQLEKYAHFMAGEITGQTKLIRNLSAGNKQKVGIVAAMLLRPQVLILDEPFNFLDPTSQSVIKHLIKEYNQETGATILISSHNLNHTVDICPRIALLEDGHIIRDIVNQHGEAQAELEDYFEVKD